MEVRILYTNWQGETRWRLIQPLGIYFGSTEWHKEKQWLLLATDLETGFMRSFAMSDIKEWEPPKR